MSEHYANEWFEDLNIGPCGASHQCGLLVRWDDEDEEWVPVDSYDYTVTDNVKPGDTVVAAIIDISAAHELK